MPEAIFSLTEREIAMNINLIRKALAIVPALALIAPAAAHAADKETFVRDGVTYTYTSTVAADGSTVLSGEAGGKPFRLVVKGEAVSGEFNYAPVRFTTADVIAQRKLAVR